MEEYYKVVSQIGDRSYLIESISDGRQREIQIDYAGIVSLDESKCEILNAVAPIGYTIASSELIFVERDNPNDFEYTIHPIEEKTSNLQDFNELKKDCIIEVYGERSYIPSGFYIIKSISPRNDIHSGVQEFVLMHINRQQEYKILRYELDNSEIRILKAGWKCLDKDVLVLKNQSGSFFKFKDASTGIGYDTVLNCNQIVSITSPEKLSVKEIAYQLGTKYQEVVNVFRNVLPDGKNVGTGIIVRLRKERDKIEQIEDVAFSISEFNRLLQYLENPATQCKSIIHWKYYTNKKWQSISCPRYLAYSDNKYKEFIPYEHLDMSEFESVKEWLNDKYLQKYKNEYFSFFHLLHWAEQIIFLRRIIKLHINGTQRFEATDFAKLEKLIEYPQYVNINILLFVHILLKLHKENHMLTNYDLYNIWKMYMPQKPMEEFGLALQDYIGTNLFCLCKGAIGFGPENWWQPNVNSDNKPIFYIFNPERIDIDIQDFNPNVTLDPTMESAKSNRAFVLFREDDNYYAKACFEKGECPVFNYLRRDQEYGEVLKTINPNESETIKIFNTCPLISVPSWRFEMAQKYKDKCSNAKPPKVSKFRLWYNRNTSIKHPFFCEGRIIDTSHKEAGLQYNWCSGNACFTDIYPSTLTNDRSNVDINIYNTAIFLNLIADNNKINKQLFQDLHSRLNWLNSAAPHFYCESCGRILEASSKKRSKLNAHAITWFECQNVMCNKHGLQIYINHCWNERCRTIVDSRETSKCPNGIYICHMCGVCCGEKMFEHKKRAGLPYPPYKHYERDMYYCYKCGRPLKQQGDRYYCSEHADVCVVKQWKYSHSVLK